MISNLVFYQLGLIALVSLFLILYGLWPSEPAAARPMTPKPLMPRGKRSKKPQPFEGLTRQPCCAACEQVIGLGHMTVDTCGKRYLPTLHMAFKAHRMSAEVPRSSKESCCPNMARRLGEFLDGRR